MMSLGRRASMGRMHLLLTIAILSGGLPSITKAATPPPTAAASHLPDGLVAVTVIRNGDEIVDSIRTLLDDVGLDETTVGTFLETNDDLTQARVALAGLAATCGSDSWGVIRALAGAEIAIGLGVGDAEEPGLILALVPRDAQTVRRFFGAVYTVTGLVRGGKPDPERSKEVNGVVAFALNDDLFQTRIDDAFLISNSKTLLQSAIETNTGDGDSLVDASWYGPAEEMIPDQALAWGAFDRNTFVDIMRQYEGEEFTIPVKQEDAGAALLFGGWAHAIAHADRFVTWVTAEDDAFVVNTHIDADESLPRSHLGFRAQSLPPSPIDASGIPGYIGEISLTRDWVDLFGERESLMSLNAAGDITEFTTTLTTIMGGLDYVDDLLSHVAGPLHFIAARQTFEDEPYLPSPQIPAFAWVTPLEIDDPRYERRLNSAMQIAASILSADAIQNNRPGTYMDVDRYRDHKIITSYYEDPRAIGTAGMMKTDGSRMKADDADETVDVDDAHDGPISVGAEYNFALASAVVDGHHIITTSADLLRDIIDQIEEHQATGTAVLTGDSAHISVLSVVDALDLNFSELVSNRMLDADRMREEAESEVRAFLEVLSMFDDLEWSSVQEDATLHTTLRISVADPNHEN